MCKHCTLVPILRLVALVVLAVGVAACLIGFVSPFWAYYDPGLPCVSPSGNDSAPVTSTVALVAAVPSTTTPGRPRAPEVEGLWARCNANNYTDCTLFWYHNFELERCFPIWHKAAQALYLAGFILLLFTLLIACAHICCGCCINSTYLPTFLGFLAVLGFLGVLASVIVYGVMAYRERGTFIQVIADDAAMTTTAATMTGVALLDWGFYVAAGGAIASLLAAVVFFCDGKRSAAAGSAGRYETAATIEM